MSDPHAHATSHAQSELDADEPRTPMWLPLLGGTLFLMAAIFALATSSNEPAASATGETPTAAAEVAAPSTAEEAPAPAPTGPRFNVRRVPEDSIQRVAPPPGVPGAPGNAPPPRMLQPGTVPPGAAPAPRMIQPGMVPPATPRPAAPPVD